MRLILGESCPGKPSHFSESIRTIYDSDQGGCGGFQPPRPSAMKAAMVGEGAPDGRMLPHAISATLP